MRSNPNRHIPAEPGSWRAFSLAVLVHLALLGLLWFGVSWQNVPPITVEAEIWNIEPSEEAPPPAPVPPVPVPEPPKRVEPPKPVPPPKPVAPALPPKVKAPEPVKPKVSDPDIALEKEKEKKEKLLKQKEKELEAKLKKEKLAEEAKEAELKQKEKELEAKLKKEKLAEEAELEAKRKKEKLAEEKALQQAEEEKRKLAEEQERKKKAEEEKRKLAEEQKRKQEEAIAAQRAKARHEEDMRRLAGEAGAGSGNAEKSQSPKNDPGYARLVGPRIKSNTIWTQDTSSNQAVEFRVDLLPDGSVRDVILLKSSENTAFDQAVKRAIYRTAPFPPDPTTDKVPTSILVSHRPKDSETR